MKKQILSLAVIALVAGSTGLYGTTTLTDFRGNETIFTSMHDMQKELGAEDRDRDPSIISLAVEKEDFTYRDSLGEKVYIQFEPLKKLLPNLKNISFVNVENVHPNGFRSFSPSVESVSCKKTGLTNIRPRDVYDAFPNIASLSIIGCEPHILSTAADNALQDYKNAVANVQSARREARSAYDKSSRTMARKREKNATKFAFRDRKKFVRNLSNNTKRFLKDRPFNMKFKFEGFIFPEAKPKLGLLRGAFRRSHVKFSPNSPMEDISEFVKTVEFKGINFSGVHLADKLEHTRQVDTIIMDGCSGFEPHHLLLFTKGLKKLTFKNMSLGVNGSPDAMPRSPKQYVDDLETVFGMLEKLEEFKIENVPDFHRQTLPEQIRKFSFKGPWHDAVGLVPFVGFEPEGDDFKNLKILDFKCTQVMNMKDWKNLVKRWKTKLKKKGIVMKARRVRR